MRILLVALVLTSSACAHTTWAERHTQAKPGSARFAAATMLAAIGQSFSDASKPAPMPAVCYAEYQCGIGHNCIKGYLESAGHCI